MTGGKRSGAGRKVVDVDVVELEKLCSLQCTYEEIAAWFNVSVRTIESRRKQPKFAEAMDRGKARGRISVRRQQMKLLESGNATMGVWLGKQLLGQRDEIDYRVEEFSVQQVICLPRLQRPGSDPGNPRLSAGAPALPQAPDERFAGQVEVVGFVKTRDSGRDNPYGEPGDGSED